MEGWSEFALFKKSDGTYILAVSEIGCGPGCDGDLKFLTYNAGKWTDVTKQFVPKLPAQVTSGDYESYWKLPRVGKTLIFVNTDKDVRDESKKLVYKEFKFEWNGATFGDGQTESENTTKIQNPNAQTQTLADENFWIGKFEFEYNGGYQLEQLEVQRSGDKLAAKYRNEVTSQVYDKFSLTVEVKGNTASFYYDKCLPFAKDEEGIEGDLPCNKTTYQKGDLMFKLQRIIQRNNKSVIKRFPEKCQDAENLERVKKFFEGIEFR